MGFDISVLIDQMKIIATLMLIGFIWKRSRLFNDDLVNSLSAILAKLILPLMLTTVIGSVSKTELTQVIKIFLATLIFYTTIIVLSKVITHFGKADPAIKRMDVLLQCFGNSGFVGVPLIISIFGDKAGIVAAAYTLVDASVYWLVGPNLLSKSKKLDFKKLVTPLTISILLGFVIVLLPIDLSENIVWATAKNVGGTAKYFASIYIGMAVARMDMTRLKNNLRSVFAAPMKLVIVPLLAYFIIGKTGFLSGDVLTMFIILCASPTGMMVPVIAEVAGESTGEYASVGVIISTVLCLVSLPFMMWMISML